MAKDVFEFGFFRVVISSLISSGEITMSIQSSRNASLILRQLLLLSRMPMNTFVSITTLTIQFFAGVFYLAGYFIPTNWIFLCFFLNPLKKSAPPLPSGFSFQFLHDFYFLADGKFFDNLVYVYGDFNENTFIAHKISTSCG